MKTVFLFLAVLLVSVQLSGQCINGYSKLLPEAAADYALDFGHSVSVFENYLAVGVPNSDTLGRQSGIIYVYEKQAGSWHKIASMTASAPVTDLKLGMHVKLSRNFLAASAEANGGQVFLFRKPATGWVSGNELAVLSQPNTASFGTAYNHPIDISGDENTIVVADALQKHNTNPTTIAGTLFIFHKDGAASWDDPSIIPTEIKATQDVIDLGRSGVYLSGNRIITGTPFTQSGTGNVLIYHDASGTFSDFSLEASMSPPGGESIWINNIVLVDDGLMTTGTGNGEMKILYYERPASGAWTSASPTYTIDPDVRQDLKNSNFINLATNGTDIYATSITSGLVYVTSLKKGSQGWLNPVRETIKIKSPSITNRYGHIISTYDGNDVVVGHMEHPANPAVSNALEIFSRQADQSWRSSTLSHFRSATRNHNFGTKVVGDGDWLFVSAIKDNSINENGGKLYVYRRDGAAWNTAATISPDFTAATERNFGSCLAVRGEFLAVGAQFWRGKGRFFIYRKGTDDWSSPELTQEIALPDPDNYIEAYGDNVAMNERWLLIPFGNGVPTGARINVAIYKNNDGWWTHHQTVEAGMMDIFNKSATVGIDIEGDTFIAKDRIYRLQDNDQWVHVGELQPSDPEPLQFNYPYFELLSNGADFGKSVKMHGDFVFVGAPKRDFQGTWDVGAVYVFSKQRTEAWSTRRESSKIVPDVKEQGSLFGTSIYARGSSLLVGSPMASVYPTGTFNGETTMNLPGSARLYRAADPRWRSSVLEKTLHGEMNVRDNFGIHVFMTDMHLMVGASLEDIMTGSTAGAVYITDAPPTLEPVATYCDNDRIAITLTASPAGGVWAGPGIVDPNTGLFDPSGLSEGLHEVVYTAPVCNTEGRMVVGIFSPPAAILTPAQDVEVCTSNDVWVELQATEQPDSKIQWFYGNDVETLLPIDYPVDWRLIARERGYYTAQLSNAHCSVFSDTIEIKDEWIELTLDSLGTICGTPSTGLPLIASPSGGYWSGPGVTDNKLHISALTDKSYEVYYTYTSERGCLYQKAMSFDVKRLPTPVVSREGNLCISGTVTLVLNSPAMPDVTYTNYWQREGSSAFVTAGNASNYEATEPGTYQLAVKNGICESLSQPIIINDSFVNNLSPASTNAEVCHSEPFRFRFEPDLQANYEWYFSESNKDFAALSGTSYELPASKTGYYYGVVKKGICEYKSLVKYLYVHPADSIFVPNVFTPNGDNINDEFKVLVFHQNDPDAGVRYEIFNRYGASVFLSPDNRAWNGEGASTGTYYWQAQYQTCQGQVVPLKGWVQLNR